LEILRGRDHSENQGINERIMNLSEIWWEGMDWMHLAQDRDQYQVLVNTIVNLQVP